MLLRISKTSTVLLFKITFNKQKPGYQNSIMTFREQMKMVSACDMDGRRERFKNNVLHTNMKRKRPLQQTKTRISELNNDIQRADENG